MSRLRDKGLRAALSALIAWLLALGLGTNSQRISIWLFHLLPWH